MLAAERRSRILTLVDNRGAISVSQLVQRFEVSDMTIRRDLDSLARDGKLGKVHGGAVPLSNLRSVEPRFEAKSPHMDAEKDAIAARAATMVQPGMSVALSAGSTTWRLAQELRSLPDLTVITNSPKVADVFDTDPRSDQTVLLTGGARTPSAALVGPLAVKSLKSLHVDLVFFGTHGFALQAGFTTPNLLEAETNQALLATGQRIVALADHSKWNVVGTSTYARLSDADTVLSDTGLSQQAQSVLAEHVKELILARPRAAALKSEEHQGSIVE